MQVLGRIEAELRTLPIVAASAVATDQPVGYFPNADREVQIAGQPSAEAGTGPRAMLTSVGGAYFETLAVRATRGRVLTAEDARPGTDGAVVNHRFVDVFLVGVDPLGARLRLRATGPKERDALAHDRRRRADHSETDAPARAAGCGGLLPWDWRR